MSSSPQATKRPLIAIVVAMLVLVGAALPIFLLDGETSDTTSEQFGDDEVIYTEQGNALVVEDSSWAGSPASVFVIASIALIFAITIFAIGYRLGWRNRGNYLDY